MEKEIFDIAIVGGGGAGTMAYLRAVLNNDYPAFFTGSGNTKRKARALWVSEVDNIPGMHNLKNPITSSTESTLKWIEEQKELKGGRVFKSTVDKIEKEDNLFKLTYKEKEEIKEIYAKYVVIATGVMDIQPKINDSIKPILPFANKGDVIYCVRCDGHKTINNKLSVIGYKDFAIAIGIMMHERYGTEVSILTNGIESEFTEKQINNAKNYNFKFYYEPITEILGNSKETGLQGFILSNGEKVETTKTIVSLGVIVYNDLLKQLEAPLGDNGKALVNEKYETPVQNVFAIGDIVEGKKMQIYTSWDQAVDALDEINRRLRREKRAFSI